MPGSGIHRAHGVPRHISIGEGLDVEFGRVVAQAIGGFEWFRVASACASAMLTAVKKAAARRDLPKRQIPG